MVHTVKYIIDTFSMDWCLSLYYNKFGWDGYLKKKIFSVKLFLLLWILYHGYRFQWLIACEHF